MPLDKGNKQLLLAYVSSRPFIVILEYTPSTFKKVTVKHYVILCWKHLPLSTVHCVS